MDLRCDVGIAERGERIFIADAGVIFNRIVPALCLLFVLSAVTVAQRYAVVWQQTRRQ
jgi:hypothetical protein